MKKLFTWCKEHILFLFSLLLMAFIPLYPKLPLIDIKNTWVYVRAEDFIVLSALVVWAWSVIRNKSSIKTPLTASFLLFWLIGAVATLHGILLIFPDIGDLFPNVAFLGYLRRIEYMSLFFVAYLGFKDKRFINYVIGILAATVFLVIVYGIGQKYLGFPAFLTMNEEFAKGIAIRLSPLSRVSSTFAGQYDLAAYLVLVLPIIISLMFGYRNWFIRIVFAAVASLGLFVLFMTVSRISVFAFVIAVGIVLLFQKKKLVLLSLPLIALVGVLILSFAPSLTERFGNTVKEIPVLVDAKTGDPIGQVKEVPNTYFKDKLVKQQFLNSIQQVIIGASPSGLIVVPYTNIPPTVDLLVVPNAPTGENLPQGTGYINLPISTVTKTLGNFYYEKNPDPKTGVIEVQIINGVYLLKKAFAYDLSFTTRFQGEWPHALAAFKRNILFGSGYGSVSMAVDNSYLRMLGETGALGFASFFAVFFVVGFYLKKTWQHIDSRITKSFLIGFIAGAIGLGINAVFIDVFEASKVAFSLWLLTGVVLGVVHLYKHIPVDTYKELRRAATSSWAVIIYLLLATILLFSPLTRNFFVGDDFTWFRWAADCPKSVTVQEHCPLSLATVAGYFTHADGFFYRPGAKTYFLFMYSFFWLNQTVYHIVSLFLHFAVACLVFLLAKKILKRTFLGALAAFLFLMLTGASEAIFWISATGFLFTTAFSLLSLLMYISWLEYKKMVYFVLTFVFFVCSLLFHELGIVTPLLLLLYQLTFDQPTSLKDLWKKNKFHILLIPIPVYAAARFFSKSLWWNGDYNYNLLKFPLNAVGNAIGYSAFTLVGPLSDRFYQTLRNGLRTHAVFAGLIALLAAGVFLFVYKRVANILGKNDKKVLVFGLLFFIIGLLPFLGLGNISSRYGYLASIGMVFVLVFFIQKLYFYLQDVGRDIAVGSVAVLVSIFCLLQVIQIRQLHGDWFEAGERVRKFFISIDSVYKDNWRTDSMEFHFVNVPIRYGQAWVFPVGMPDALWFVFRNPNIKVYSWPSLHQAFSAVLYESKTQHVFVFDDTGAVKEEKKPINFQ